MFALIFAIFQFREEENLKIVEEKYESNQFSCIRIITNLFIAICNIYRNGAHHDPARVKCCNLHVDHLLESTLGLLHVLSRSPKNAEFISNKVCNTGFVNEIKKLFQTIIQLLCQDRFLLDEKEFGLSLKSLDPNIVRHSIGILSG